MARKPNTDYLMFIDTNIYLDFYRARDKTFEKQLISKIKANRDKIITTDQIFMEYLKNRQATIVETLKQLKMPDINIKPPAFLSDSLDIKKLNDEKESITMRTTKLKRITINVLQEPKKYDDLYKFLIDFFQKEHKYHLSRTNKLRFIIRRLARKRFCLGYPPRKDKDMSIGDAINWEWIIHCSEKSKKNIVIVSRDSDYGIPYDKQSVLNDWLSLEFKDRVAKRRKIVLTNNLSDAFQLLNVKISDKFVKEEKETISEQKKAEQK